MEFKPLMPETPIVAVVPVNAKAIPVDGYVSCKLAGLTRPRNLMPGARFEARRSITAAAARLASGRMEMKDFIVCL